MNKNVVILFSSVIVVVAVIAIVGALSVPPAHYSASLRMTSHWSGHYWSGQGCPRCLWVVANVTVANNGSAFDPNYSDWSLTDPAGIFTEYAESGFYHDPGSIASGTSANVQVVFNDTIGAGYSQVVLTLPDGSTIHTGF